MSFSEEIKAELRALPIKANCCRRAAALGILTGASRLTNDAGALGLSIVGRDTADFATGLLRRQFNREPSVTERRYLGRDVFDVTLFASAAIEMLDQLDTDDGFSGLFFKCPACEEHFFRGVFLVAGSCSDPDRASHLELFFHDARRASRLWSLLQAHEIPPGIVNRKNGCGLYFKKSAAIVDFMTLIGGGKRSFEMLNRQIERDIRNNENRATNCVTRNIQSTVSASARQAEAIERLIDLGKLETLPPELLVTAQLRLRNEEATLAELAALHDPPISKSGLNHRLERIIELSEEADKRHSRKEKNGSM